MKPRRAPKRHDKASRIAELAAQDKSSKEIAEQLGVSARIVRRELETDAILREAEAQIDLSTLSATERQKVEAAIRQHKRKLDCELGVLVQAGIDDWMDKFRPHLEAARAVESGRKGLVTGEEGAIIKRCLHPDNSAGADTRNKAFIIWQRIEHIIMSEEDAPTVVPFPGRRKKAG
jgi:hypothetical protein